MRTMPSTIPNRTPTVPIPDAQANISEAKFVPANSAASSMSDALDTAHSQNTTILSQPQRDRPLLHEHKQGGMRISCLKKKPKNKKADEK